MARASNLHDSSQGDEESILIPINSQMNLIMIVAGQNNKKNHNTTTTATTATATATAATSSTTMTIKQ